MSKLDMQPSDAIPALLSRALKSGFFGGSLPFAAEKLDRPCRLYRKKRLAAAAVEFAVVAPVFLLLVFGMIGTAGWSWSIRF